MSTPTPPPDPATPPPEPTGPRLLNRPWLHGLVLTLTTFVAYGASLEGGLVWDDDRVIGAAASLPRAAAAFTTDLFGTGRGPGAVYYRPLTTLSYWVDVHLFQAAPHVGMHAVNLVWHAIASVLALRALRRWLGHDRPLSGAVALAAALLWAITPQKAENVAWITGRGDVLGVVFALIGLELAARATTARARMATAAAATLLAVLCKEALVAVPALFLGEALARTAASSRAVAHVREALRDPATRGSLAAAIVYLALRSLWMPIASGGEGMLAAIPRVDKLVLFLETSGTATAAIFTPWRSVLLRSPIAFDGPTRLVHVPALALLGVATWTAFVVAFFRFPRARGPLALTAGAFLPVSNLVSTGLESRLSDRFLYLPTLGIAWGIALLLARSPHARVATSVAMVAALLLGLRTASRSALFISSDTLFAWEVANGDGAGAVYDNAARAAARARRYRDARDLYLREVDRMHELGFKGEGFGNVVEAVRSQVWATGETHPASQTGFEEMARALLAGRDGVVTAELDDGRVIGVPSGSPAAADYLATYRGHLALSLGRVLARTGREEEALAITAEAVARCPSCHATLVAAAENAVAAGRPDLAHGWLGALETRDARSDGLRAVADVQAALASGDDPRLRALGRFAGGAFGRACAEGAPAEGLPAAGRFAIAASCRLAAQADGFRRVAGYDARFAAEVERIAESLRNDDDARAELAREAMTAH